MGCAASSAGGPYYGNDVGPDGPLEAAPSNLLISGHPDAMYNGLFTRGTVAWNAKAMYSNGRRFIYYYACAEGGAPGWSFDHRDQPGDMGRRDWCDGGYIPLERGPSFPPLSQQLELVDVEGHHDVRVSIWDLEPAMPHAGVSISGHPEESANGLYQLAPGLWNGQPHYSKPSGKPADEWHLYYYACTEGGQPSWSLSQGSNPDGAKDLCEGGWVGPCTWAHPPIGDTVGFNCVGQCSVRASGGDAAVAAQVHALLLAHRQQLLAGLEGMYMAMPPTANVSVPIAVAQPMAVASPIAMGIPSWSATPE